MSSRENASVAPSTSTIGSSIAKQFSQLGAQPYGSGETLVDWKGVKSLVGARSSIEQALEDSLQAIRGQLVDTKSGPSHPRIDKSSTIGIGKTRQHGSYSKSFSLVNTKSWLENPVKTIASEFEGEQVMFLILAGINSDTFEDMKDSFKHIDTCRDLMLDLAITAHWHLLGVDLRDRGGNHFETFADNIEALERTSSELGSVNDKDILFIYAKIKYRKK